MRERNCRNCLFGDKCPAAQACDFYAPLDDDGGTDEYIENERQEFYKDWLRYTSETDD